MKLVITAGGQGTKLWPSSRESKPKQFQKIIGDKTLFSYNVALLLKQYKPEDIYINTKRMYLKWAVEQAPAIPLKNSIIEPDCKNGRGPAEGFIFVRLAVDAPNEPFMLVQSDDLRYPEEKYLSMLMEIEKLEQRDQKYITGGMKALYPTLGVDYIKLGDRVESNPEFEIYKSEAFIKRTDDYAKTKELIENYHITIHCNHTCWYPELMLEAYKQFHPAWYASLVQIRDLFAKSAPDSDIENSYAQMPKGSTEEVIEHVLKDGYVVLLPYKWTDIGTWDSVYQHFAQNNENYSDGKLVSINSKGSFVKTCSNSSKIVVVSDIDNLVVIDTEDALLVLPRDKADSIQKIQKELRLKNLESYL